MVMNSKLFGIGLGILLLIGAGVFISATFDLRGDDNAERIIQGDIRLLDFNARTFSIHEGGGNRATTVSFSATTTVSDRNGLLVGGDYLERGFSVEVRGKGEGDALTATEIKVLNEPNIIVFSPVVKETVGETFKVEGRARVFENTLAVRVKNGEKKIFEKSVMADAPDVGTFGDFETEIKLAAKDIVNATSIVLEAFEYSAKDGSEINKVTVSLVFKSRAASLIKVKVFFPNTVKDPNITCTRVFPIEREVPITEGVARAALEELLKGPTPLERRDGYTTSINDGVKVQSVSIQSGIARADFNPQLDYQVGGACRVTSIRAQITQTLKQFPTVQEVRISINGNEDEILQP